MRKIFLPFLMILFINAIFFTGCAKKEEPTQEQMSRASYYNDLIKDIINISPKQLGLKLPDDTITVYGVVSAQNIGNIMYVVSASYETGEAVDIAYWGNSFINMGEKGTSSGISELMYNNAKRYLKYYESDIEKYWKGASIESLSQNLLMTFFINHDANSDIRDEVKKLVGESQKSISHLTEVEKDGSLPAVGAIKIIFLTNKGRYFVEGTMKEIADKHPELRTFFLQRRAISDTVIERFSAVNGR